MPHDCGESGMYRTSPWYHSRIRSLDEVKIQKAFLSMSPFKAAMVAMKACDANGSLSGSGDVVLRTKTSTPMEQRVDPWMVELRAEMLLERDLGGAGSQDVRGELEWDDSVFSVFNESSGPLPITEGRFVVGVDTMRDISRSNKETMLTM